MSDQQKKMVSAKMTGKSRNLWEVLDEGRLKPVPEVIMSNKKQADWKIIRRFLTCDKRTISKTIMDPVTFEETRCDEENQEYREPSERYLNFKRKFYDEKFTSVLKQEYTYGMVDGWSEQDKHIISVHWGWQKMLDYLGIVPFIPSVMINISPDWSVAGRVKTDRWKIKILENQLLKYLNTCNRWDKASYVIENGSDGDHIHLHCVAQMSKATLKSVETHVAKGGISTTLQKQTKKLKGMEGLLKGVGIQTRTLRTELLVSDKMDYLIDAKKPEGHKNHSVIFEKKDLVF
jgi:hypothetical protein